MNVIEDISLFAGMNNTSEYNKERRLKLLQRISEILKSEKFFSVMAKSGEEYTLTRFFYRHHKFLFIQNNMHLELHYQFFSSDSAVTEVYVNSSSLNDFL